MSGYADYGGRGIRVCKEWAESFDAFFSALGRRPSARHSLGRINNDGHYEPGNVAWELPEAQQNNRRASRFVQYYGRTMTVAQAIRAAGSIVAQDTVNYRLKQGWSVERAVHEVPKHRLRARPMEGLPDKDAKL